MYMFNYNELPEKLVLFGTGCMGSAMLGGWLRLGIEPSRISVIDPRPSEDVLNLSASTGVGISPDARGLSSADVLVLAIKPGLLETIGATTAGLMSSDTVLVSVMAGRTLEQLRSAVPVASAYVRAMPNLPASVGRGITAVTGNGLHDRQQGMVDALLSGLGEVEWLADEAQMDAATAVSGSGPAYVFYLVECLTRAGIAEGLPPETAARLASATIEGAGELLFRSCLPADTLRQNVTSPGGTTAAALDVLMGEAGLAPLMLSAVAEAKRRSAEISQKPN